MTTIDKKQVNSLHAGYSINVDRVAVFISDKDKVETIGLTPHEVNNGLDYALYRLLGPEWKKDDENLIRIDSKFDNETLWITGREFDMFLNFQLPQKPNSRIKEYFSRVSEHLEKDQPKTIKP